MSIFFISFFDNHRMVIKKFRCCLLFLRSCWCGLLLHQSGVMCTVMSKTTRSCSGGDQRPAVKDRVLATEAEGRF